MIKFNQQALIGICLLILSDCLFSQEETKEVDIEATKATPSTSSVTYSERLSTYYNKEALIWINEEEKQVFMVKSDNLHKITYGNILFISEKEERPLSIGVNEVLDQKLSRLGWNIFHIYLPGTKVNDPNPIDESTSNNDSQNESSEQSTLLPTDYNEQITSAINLIRSSTNDEVFILVKGFSSDTILKILGDQLAQVDGVVFLLPKIVTFTSERRQKLSSLSIPQYIFYSKNKRNNEQTDNWLNFLYRSQHPLTTIDKNLETNHSFEDGSFYAFRIHRWLKNLTIKNPN